MGKQKAKTTQKPQLRVALAVGYPSGYEGEIVRGAIDYAEHLGRWTFVGREPRPFQSFEQIDLGAVDGIIGNFYKRSWAEAVDRASVAAVNTSTAHADLSVPRVGKDDEMIGRMGAEHLLGLGFTEYGFVTTVNAWYSERRCKAFVQAIEENAGRACHVLKIPEQAKESAIPLLHDWLQTVPRPIAVMTANDNVARMAINAAVELGLHVPEDMAVLGVDNDRWETALSPVPISSVETDARQIGYRAAKLLDRLMAGEAPPPPQWVPCAGVVTRLSTDIVLAEDPLVVDALRFIREQCGEGLHVDDMLEELRVSRRTLETRMKQATGQTPQTAIYRAQIDQARNLLINSDQTMGEIARACGFERQERFNVVFKRLVGITPGRYRRRGVRDSAKRPSRAVS
ncbi:MAG: DNA-binding transcriptional regulator [Pirellulaceae bacterium]